MRITGPCEVCREHPAKYRCSKCRRTVYCGAACFKLHKEGMTCSAPVRRDDLSSQQSASSGLDQGNDSDRIDPEVMQRLGQDRGVVDDLKDVDLKNALRVIDSAPSNEDKERLLDQAMHHEGFVSFANRCLSIVTPDDVDRDRVRLAADIADFTDSLKDQLEQT